MPFMQVRTYLKFNAPSWRTPDANVKEHGRICHFGIAETETVVVKWELIVRMSKRSWN